MSSQHIRSMYYTNRCNAAATRPIHEQHAQEMQFHYSHHHQPRHHHLPLTAHCQYLAPTVAVRDMTNLEGGHAVVDPSLEGGHVVVDHPSLEAGHAVDPTWVHQMQEEPTILHQVVGSPLVEVPSWDQAIQVACKLARVVAPIPVGRVDQEIPDCNLVEERQEVVDPTWEVLRGVAEQVPSVELDHHKVEGSVEVKDDQVVVLAGELAQDVVVPCQDVVDDLNQMLHEHTVVLAPGLAITFVVGLLVTMVACCQEQLVISEQVVVQTRPVELAGRDWDHPETVVKLLVEQRASETAEVDSRVVVEHAQREAEFD